MEQDLTEDILLHEYKMVVLCKLRKPWIERNRICPRTFCVLKFHDTPVYGRSLAVAKFKLTAG